jgi:tellurite resistance protein
MVGTVASQPSPKPYYSAEQIAAWLQGLLTVAWADGHFDEEEKVLIQGLLEEEALTSSINLEQFEPIAVTTLQETFGGDHGLAQNFLRTAVMVAVADGVYSAPEDALLHQFAQALSLEDQILDSLRATLYHPEVLEASGPMALEAHPLHSPHEHHFPLLHPVQDWMDGLEVHDPRVARFICRLIPPQCPFERDIVLFGRKLVHIPPLCQLNPLYEQLVGLRFRALSYLADDCGEDVSPYC